MGVHTHLTLRLALGLNGVRTESKERGMEREKALAIFMRFQFRGALEDTSHLQSKRILYVTIDGVQRVEEQDGK